jgi:mono/diheme cytochrome c family protein
MRRIVVCFLVFLLAGLGIGLSKQSKTTAEQTGEASAAIPAEASAKKNPVKVTPESLAEAKKLYGYDCAMCHGKAGDGKGDLADQMKLDLHDWRDATSIAKMTDGDLFYIISVGRGKMTGEGDRMKEDIRWNLVIYVRSFGQKGAAGAAKPQ